MVPFLYTDLTDLIMKILELFVKLDVLKDKSGYELKNIEDRKVENILKLSSIKLGFAAERLLARMKERDEASDNQIKQFRKDSKRCQTFLVRTISKLFERSSLGTVIVRNATCFDPLKIAQVSAEVNGRKMKSLLHHLLRLKLLTAQMCDKAQSQYATLIKDELSCT